jgi:hypothetical protein
VFDYYLLGKMPAGPAPIDEQDEPVTAASTTRASTKR